jgi:putative hydrolase of the HAD superfamily
VGSNPTSASFLFDGIGILAERRIQAVFFDIGETLLNFGRVDAASLFRQGGKLAYDFLKKLNQPAGSPHFFLLGHLWVIRLFRIWSYISKRDFDSLELLKRIGKKKGIKLSEAQWQDFAWCWYEPLSKFTTVEADIKQTLSKLRQAGIKLGILSNTFINAVVLERHLAQFGILEFFNVRLYSYQFRFRKPDSRIFKEAARKVSCEPANVLFVGDRLDTDINGALKANMPAAIKKAYTNMLKKVPEDVIKIERLAELPAIIAEINGK